MGSIGFWNLFIVTLSAVGSGPAGIEGIVGAGGLSVGVAAIVVFPFIWGYVQAFVAVKLAEKHPQNGGAFLWCLESLGAPVGINVGIWAVLVNCSTAAFVSELTSEYVATVLPFHKTYVSQLELTVATVLLSFLINVVSVDFMCRAFWFITLHSVVVFAILSAYALPKMSSDRFENPGTTLRHTDWALLLNLLIFNCAGFDSAASVAGQMVNGRKIFPRVVLAVSLVISSWFILTLVFTFLATRDPYQNWHAGFFSTVALELAGPWLQVWVVIACSLINVQTFSSSFLTAYVVTAAMAERGFVPRSLARRNRGGQPVRAMVACCVVSILFALLPYKENLAVESMLYVLIMLAEVACFLSMSTNPSPWRRRAFVIPVLLLSSIVLFIQKRAALVVTGFVLLVVAVCTPLLPRLPGVCLQAVDPAAYHSRLVSL